MFFLSAVNLPRTRFYNTIQHGSSVAQADVNSANVVGYQSVSITNGTWQLITATFKTIAGTKGYDIQDVRVIDPDTGAEFGTNNRVKIQLIEKKSTGGYGTQYNWRITDDGHGGQNIGWHQGSTYIGRDVLYLSDAQCFVVNTGGTKVLEMRFSGEVELNPTSMEIPKSSWEIIGNMTPVRMDIQDVKVYNGEVILETNNRVKIQKIEKAATGGYGTQYNWRITDDGHGGQNVGWHQGSTYIGRGVLFLEPGEGMAVNNGFTGADSVVLKFKKPIEVK